MPRRAEDHLLVDVVGVGHHRVIGGDHLGHVDRSSGCANCPARGLAAMGTILPAALMLVSGGRPVYLNGRSDVCLAYSFWSPWAACSARFQALIEAAWPHSPDTIGGPTLIINVTGCFLIGALLGAIGPLPARAGAHPPVSSASASSAVTPRSAAHRGSAAAHRARQGGVGLGYLAYSWHRSRCGGRRRVAGRPAGRARCSSG